MKPSKRKATVVSKSSSLLKTAAVQAQSQPNLTVNNRIDTLNETVQKTRETLDVIELILSGQLGFSIPTELNKDTLNVNPKDSFTIQEKLNIIQARQDDNYNKMENIGKFLTNAL